MGPEGNKIIKIYELIMTNSYTVFIRKVLEKNIKFFNKVKFLDPNPETPNLQKKVNAKKTTNRKIIHSVSSPEYAHRKIKDKTGN